MFPFQQFLQFAINPVQYFNRMGIQIPEDCKTPNQMVQYLMNSGKLNQQQYNSIVQQSNQIQKDPQFNQLINNVNKPNSNITPNTVSDDNKQI